jgi:hypothetical protein
MVKMHKYYHLYGMVDRRPAYNITHKKLAVQRLTGVLCFVSSSVLADSLFFEIANLL